MGNKPTLHELAAFSFFYLKIPLLNLPSSLSGDQRERKTTQDFSEHNGSRTHLVKAPLVKKLPTIAIMSFAI